MRISSQNTLWLLENALAQKLYKKLILQLCKDFELANIPMEISVTMDPGNLITVLKEKIYRLLLDQFADYLNLMYEVDVPESDFKEMEGNNVVEVAEQVVYLMVKRELQKVTSKARYL
jgi:hypothetical protein